MCDVHDVLEASYGSADGMVSAIYDFGNNALGNGIRRFAKCCYQQGAIDATPYAYRRGLAEGSLLTTGVFITIGLVAWKANTKKTVKREENTETEYSETKEVKGDA